MVDFSKIKQEIIGLLENQKLHKVLVFGSYAYGQPHDESDVDLLVILDKRGISRDYKQMLENKKRISKLLRKMRKSIPIDLLVYTIDEWEMLKNSRSSFINQIEKKGVRLI